mmetsp:Transcript_29822/g.45501  ORF Transcript_29822/g.45501 Transcript_29822/m.45501 type:complete len:312 (-) Transcript_29822:1642-2577(-)
MRDSASQQSKFSLLLGLRQLDVDQVVLVHVALVELAHGAVGLLLGLEVHEAGTSGVALLIEEQSSSDGGHLLLFEERNQILLVHFGLKVAHDNSSTAIGLGLADLRGAAANGLGGLLLLVSLSGLGIATVVASLPGLASSVVVVIVVISTVTGVALVATASSASLILLEAFSAVIAASAASSVIAVATAAAASAATVGVLFSPVASSGHEIFILIEVGQFSALGHIKVDSVSSLGLEQSLEGLNEDFDLVSPDIEDCSASVLHDLHVPGVVRSARIPVLSQDLEAVLLGQGASMKGQLDRNLVLMATEQTL